MLHLYPIRLIFTLVAILTGGAILIAVYLGTVGAGNLVADAVAIIRTSLILALASVVLFTVGWRWVPLAQRTVFPYLGGRWSGQVNFETPSGAEHRDVQLEIKHSPFGLKLLLDSAESSSHTLVATAVRDHDFPRYRIYYVYLNVRKEGVPGAGDHYRGLAVLRVEPGRRSKLHGDYFTETNRRGTLHLHITEPNPWWKLWR